MARRSGRAAAAALLVLAVSSCAATRSGGARTSALERSGPPSTTRPAAATPATATTGPPAPTGPPRTSCTEVVHVGESTSVGLTSSHYLPRTKDRLAAQLHAVGVRRVRTDISGARSIVERWHGQPNAQEAVRAQTAQTAGGYRGCWSIAMGTNEAANRAAGSAFDARQRIDLLMRAIGTAPVLWLTVKTLRRSGYYDDANMRRFNTAVVEACRRYPNLRVYDWAGEVKDGWFSPDGIHFTSAGYRQRAHRIARALARAYPRGFEASPDCVVHLG